MQKPKILIVDDNLLNTKLLSIMLGAGEYETITAMEGKTAVEKARSENPDLILMDIMMPVMGGYEATEILKQDPDTKDIPIIMITALDGAEDKLRGLEAGADEFLNKPVNAAELMARAKSLLRLKLYQEQLKSRTDSKESMVSENKGEVSGQKELNLPTILVVEDEDKDVRLIQNYLQGEACQIVVAKTGEETLSRVLKEKIDLVLLDILLPGINGFQVVERLREMECGKNLQIVALTNLRDMESKIKGIELGVDDYLVKPINKHELRIRIRSLVKKKGYLDSLKSEHASANHTAITDKLTGLYNRAYFEHYINLEIKRAERQSAFLSLIMMDIDDFKKYNDTYGHPTGDAFLKWIGKVVRESIREVDVPARYGGEEFAVVLPYADREGAPVVAERVRTAISAESFVTPDMKNTGKTTVSMGIAYYPEDAASAKELIKLADKALSRAKREGKDRVCIYQKDAETPAETEASVHNHSPAAGDIDTNHQNELPGL